MPALDVQNAVISTVTEVKTLLEQVLAEAESIKPVDYAKRSSENIEPSLKKSDFRDLSVRVAKASSTGADQHGGTDEARTRQNTVIEIAARDIFGDLVSSTSIDSPAFVRTWNFLDILSILSETNQCDPALLFWLVEELLESQTIAGCRLVFGWLESRRDRITPESTYKKWSLIILRICNELLRRLSRAEDNVFCGRVFILLFQCVPLGDRSSVNLQGEYHVENVTTYETGGIEDGTQMDVDSSLPTPQGATGPKTMPTGENANSAEPLTSEALYLLFWSLQESFSQPLTLFKATNMHNFKRSVEETVKKFESFPPSEVSRLQSTQEDSRQGLKRKRGEDDKESIDVLETFNPKYLTSKDLFELEVNDLTFRRHILVQTLIILNFILAWTDEEKRKYGVFQSSNRNLFYTGTFSDEDATWAQAQKNKIINHMRRDTAGRIFCRMVETVLSRDKNWVYWKMGGCPTIKRPPVEPQLYADAKVSAQKLASSKRLRPLPMGAVSLDFLRHSTENVNGAPDANTKRLGLPELESFKHSIASDDFEISMPTNDQTKAKAVSGKASKSWRALRIAGRSRLNDFDRIDDSNTIGIIFEEPRNEDQATEIDEEVTSDKLMPEKKDPVLISGATGVGKTSLLKKLLESHKGVFAPVVRHTTRDPTEGEIPGKDFEFVKVQDFNQLRDGDRLIEYSEEDDISYGTSTKSIETITAKGKIPVIELNLQATQFAKDMGFSARYILIQPPSPDTLQAQLGDANESDGKASSTMEHFSAHLEPSKAAEMFDIIIVNDDLEVSHQTLINYLYAEDKNADGSSSHEDHHDQGLNGASAIARNEQKDKEHMEVISKTEEQ